MKNLILTILFIFPGISPVTGQETPSVPGTEYKVRISNITVDRMQLDSYNQYLREEIEASMQHEPGVLTLYAVAQQDHPHKITILEIYLNEDAYQRHIRTPHFLKYKEATKDMVLELELIDTIPLIPELKIK